MVKQVNRAQQQAAELSAEVTETRRWLIHGSKELKAMKRSAQRAARRANKAVARYEIFIAGY